MSVTRLKANGDKFTLYAVCNSRGDVEELRKEDGTIYARYVYDSWGNVLHIYSGTGTTEITSTANLAVQNPFRYRGYYYDTESGLYYLQSRYYDPVTGRFVNPDSLVDNSDVLGFNMYTYCGNNPVSREDSGGNLWDTLFDIASVAYSAYQVCKEPTNLSNWASLAADVASLVIPGITGGGAAVRALTKADDVIDAAKAIDKVDDAVKIQKAVDFTEDALDTINTLDRSSGFTKSTAKAGQKIHKGYKATSDFIPQYKEYRKIKGIRPDYVDFTSDVITIYELKPNNPKAIASGIKQLHKYNDAFGGGCNMILELY